MSTPYVVSGAILECSLGTKPSVLRIEDTRSVRISGESIAIIEDFTSESIGSFVNCRVSVPPISCAPNCVKWREGKDSVLSIGVPSLLETSITICLTGGGIVSIRRNGQGEGMVSTPELREFMQVLRQIAKLSDRETARILRDALSVLKLRDRIGILSIVLGADQDVQSLFFMFADKVKIGCIDLSCCAYNTPHFNPIDGTIHFDVALDREGHNGQAMPFYYFFHEIGHMFDWAIANLLNPDTPNIGFQTRDVEPFNAKLFKLLGDDVRNSLLDVAVILGEEHGMLRYIEDRESAMYFAVDGIMNREKVVIIGETGREQQEYIFRLDEPRLYQHLLQVTMNSVLDGEYPGFSVYIPATAMRSIADVIEGVTNNTVHGHYPRVPLEGNIEPNNPIAAKLTWGSDCENNKIISISSNTVIDYDRVFHFCKCNKRRIRCDFANFIR